ncbi:3-oxoacyl-(acyl-carrier protein) reductase [Vibrio ishigakensis]|uniref:3-oxoacyl-(Acyl-carrier protein) reductase n=1 Tax=Vibrio ishigakensis TaxID=1481914 RepID=A0A0B8NVM1_9VIBR|nr:SDR family oxidoreductase [Vibrio ishigakensis]GAM57956.1 3-oxoacyl-(acyl-carrier protein) reductase [Vibrio ishigakensis]
MSKATFITGGVGKIGRAICISLANQGYKVFFTHRGSEAGKANASALLEELNGEGHKAVCVDITDHKAYELTLREVIDADQAIDLVINCAGTTQFVAPSDLDGLSEELVDRIFQVNVRAAITTVRLLEPHLQLSDNHPCIINISSIAAKTAIGSNIAYCASKAAMDSLTMSLARSLGPKIRVLSVSPGLADTDFVKGVDTRWRDEQLDKTPLKSLVSPEQVAEAVLSAKEHLLFTTGAVIPVDGGRPLN